MPFRRKIENKNFISGYQAHQKKQSSLTCSLCTFISTFAIHPHYRLTHITRMLHSWAIYFKKGIVMKRILLCIALMGTVTIKAMDLKADFKNNNNIDLVTAEQKRLAEKGRKNAQQQAIAALAATLSQENAAQKNTITNLEKEISSLQSKLFFWRTPAILAGLAASVYGSWLIYEWWNGESVAPMPMETAIDEDDEKASALDDETSQPSAPSMEDVKDVFTVPNTTPPGN